MFIKQKNGVAVIWNGVLPEGAEELSEDQFNNLVKDLDSQRDKELVAANSYVSEKFSGFDYSGVMCSATRDDQNGLLAVQSSIEKGWVESVNFEFSNGNKLEITAKNIGDFAPKWAAFRQSFFK